MIRVDTNYIIRYLLNDNIEMADIAEVVYVLFGVYKISRIDIANQLLELVDFVTISVSNLKVIKYALNIFKEKNLDFVDCLLCAYSKEDEILTFDKKLNKCVANK